MDNFKTLCEMDIAGLMKAMMGGDEQKEPVKQDAFVVQPDNNVGETGKINGDSGKNIQISQSDDGGICIKSADLNINLCKKVFEAVKEFIKGENNG